MRILEIEDRQTWQTFVEVHVPASGAFLHDWSYGEMGAKRIGAYENERLIGVAMVTRVHLPLGLSYALIQKGPICSEGVDVVSFVKALGEMMKVIFVRFEPLVFSELRIQHSELQKTIHISPEETLLLDLTKTEDELLADMHQKTRYNIRLAEKKGVEVRELQESEWGKAWEIFEETAKRDGFRLHAKDRYVAWLKQFPGARLVGAFFEDQLLAVNLQVDAFGVRTYLHGASSNTHREVMAPYAMHWQEIREAKHRGLHTYDFWGVSDTNPAWKGITRFKRGFGGVQYGDPGTFDLVVDRKKFLIYTLLRRLRRSVSVTS